MSTRLTPAPPGYEPVKIAGRWLMMAYTKDRRGAITAAHPIVITGTAQPMTWSRRKLAIDAFVRELLYKELEELRAYKRDRDATSVANVVAS